MYRRKKKQKKGRNKTNTTREVHSMTDFTVQEFANNPKPVASFRKKHFMTTSVFTKHAVEEIPEPIEDVMLRDDEGVENWYERDLSEFDGNPHRGYGQSVQTVDDHGSKKSGKNLGGCNEVEEGFQGRDYPADLWYILANFIFPEDVGRFSALCKGAFHVTKSVGFWRKLYFRWWREKVLLPRLLRPYHVRYSEECLRAKVISALYRMYPPFLERHHLGMMDFSNVESYSLIGSTCLYSCYQDRVGNNNNFCHFIKFRRLPTVREQNMRNGLVGGSPALWGNPWEGEVLLKVTCPGFQHFTCENIMGLQLASVSLSVGQDMCYNRFKMEFVRNFHPRKRIDPKESRTVVVLDPVICVSIMNWWQPSFVDTFEPNSSTGRRRGSGAMSDSLWDV